VHGGKSTRLKKKLNPNKFSWDGVHLKIYFDLSDTKKLCRFLRQTSMNVTAFNSQSVINEMSITELDRKLLRLYVWFLPAANRKQALLFGIPFVSWDSTIISSNHTFHAANKKLRRSERLNQQLWTSTPRPLLSLLRRIESETKKTLNFTRVGLIWKFLGGRLFTHRLSRLGAR